MICIFCKIINGEIPCDKIYEDDKVICFNDISKKAPIHVLVVPKKHVENILECVGDDDIINDIVFAIDKVTQILNIKESGFRTVINTGKDGGQSVEHLHFHILAGKTFDESFG